MSSVYLINRMLSKTDMPNHQTGPCYFLVLGWCDRAALDTVKHRVLLPFYTSNHQYTALTDSFFQPGTKYHVQKDGLLKAFSLKGTALCSSRYVADLAALTAAKVPKMLIKSFRRLQQLECLSLWPDLDFVLPVS